MTGDYFLEGAKKGRSSIFVSAKLEGTGNLPTNWKVLIRAWKNCEIAARLKDPSKANEKKIALYSNFSNLS